MPLERDFDEDEVRAIVFALLGDKDPRLDGFQIAFFQCFFQCFWDITKVDIMAFLREFHAKGKLLNNLDASFIALILKMAGADCLKDFRPISLIGSIYKILAKVLTGRLQKVIPSIIYLILRSFFAWKANF